jgi:hypothetical protein
MSLLVCEHLAATELAPPKYATYAAWLPLLQMRQMLMPRDYGGYASS